MSICLSSKEGVVARKRHHCAFCFEPILPGDKYDQRKGVAPGDGHWTMHMHPECHAYEDTAMDADDYEDMSEPSFTRAEAIAFVETARRCRPGTQTDVGRG